MIAEIWLEMGSGRVWEPGSGVQQGLGAKIQWVVGSGRRYDPSESRGAEIQWELGSGES